MERTMEPVEVYVGTKGHVVIAQASQFGQNDAMILLHPKQAEVIAEWLKLTAAEAEAGTAERNMARN